MNEDHKNKILEEMKAALFQEIETELRGIVWKMAGISLEQAKEDAKTPVFFSLEGVQHLMQHCVMLGFARSCEHTMALIDAKEAMDKMLAGAMKGGPQQH